MIVAILISVHLLADFLFQSSAVLERKRQERNFLFLHCFIYFVKKAILTQTNMVQIHCNNRFLNKNKNSSRCLPWAILAFVELKLMKGVL